MRLLDTLSPFFPAVPLRSARHGLARRLLAAGAVLVALPLASPSASAQALNNGGVVSGAISTAGGQDSYTFAASAGESYQLRMVDSNTTTLSPQMMLYGPGGGLLVNTWGNLVAAIGGQASTGGTYTLVVADWNGTETGAYDIYFTLAPGANEGGALINGGSVSGTVDLGDLDSYTFTASAGQSYQLRMADVDTTALAPQMILYGPGGGLVVNTWGNLVASIGGAAATSGTYTLVVADKNTTGTGDYDIYFTLVPGANEGGALVNGGTVSGTIELGDLDSYTFTANAGESYQLRMTDVGATAFAPQMILYGPGGGLVANTWGNSVAALGGAAASSGTYTLVVADKNTTGTGPYDIDFTYRPGANEGGALINGGVVSGTIELGDLDSYTFAASAGDSYQLRTADVGATAFAPQMILYGPGGGLVANTWGNLVAALGGPLTTSGTYTLVVADKNTTGTGAYDIYFTLAPGANEGGALINGGSLSGVIDLGDLDSYTFAASAGDSYQLRMADAGATAFAPQMILYGPGGGLVANTWGNLVAALGGPLTTSGTYTLVVADKNYNATGAYDIYFTLAPGANEGGALTNGGSLSGVIDLGDLDSFTFTALAGQNVQLEMVDTNLTALAPQLLLYGPGGGLLINTWGNDVATINTTASTTGTYTLVAADKNFNGTGIYGLGFSRGLETYCTPGTSGSGCTALMSATGDPSAGAGSGFVVRATGGEGDKDGLFFFGTNGRQANSWGNGTSYQCVVPPVKRSPVSGSGGTSGNCDAAAALDFNALITAQPAKAPATGAVVQIQYWYRDPFNTSNQTTSLSDALEFTLYP